MTSADVLRAMSEQELMSLLRARPDLAVPPPADSDVLAHRAAGRLSVVRALERLDTFALEVLQALVDARTSEQDVGRLDLDPAVDLDPILAQLRVLGLIWPDDSAIAGTPADPGDPRLQGIAVLDTVVTVLGIVPGTTGRSFAELQVPPPADPAALVRACEPAERAVLDRLAAGPARGSFRSGSSSAGHPVAQLLDHGLLVDIGGGQVELPREVGALIRAEPRPAHPEPPAIDPPVRDADAVDGAAAGQALETLRTTEALLNALAADPPAQLRSGGLGVRELRRISRDLGTDDPTVTLLLELVYAAGLLAPTRDTTPVWLPTTDYDEWRERSAERRWPLLATAWLELRRLPLLVGRRDEHDRLLVPLSPPLDRSGMPDARRGVLDLLAELTPGTAPVAADVESLLSWRAPRRGDRLRGEIVAATLREAESLGVTGRGALGEVGRALLAGDDPGPALTRHLPEPVAEILLQADLTAVAPGPLVPELAAELTLVADVESAGGATVYRITTDSVRRALDAGRSAADLHRLFTSRSRTPVPQALTYLVDDAARRHGGLRVGAVRSYLRCEDGSTLAVLLADRSLAPLALRALAPTVAVSPVAPGEVLDLLRAAGQAPMLEAADGGVVIEAPTRRRSTPERRVRPPASTGPDDASLSSLVDDMRNGDVRSRVRARVARSVGEIPGLTTAGVLGTLQRAVDGGDAVNLSYVDNDGAAVTRLVRPRSVNAGFLRAEDERAESTLSVALHRVTSVTDAG